jgi:Tfp pilus assembly protein PilX
MNNRGVALIISYMVVSVLTILSSVFLVGSSTESNVARNYSNSSRAFWIAEAGMAQAYQNWVNNTTQPVGGVSFGAGAYSIDTSSLPIVTVTGTCGSATRSIQVSFVRIPSAFDNTVSVGNMTLNGLLAKVEVYDKTRISGTFSKTAFATATFSDKQEGVSKDATTIKIPDYNNNGTTDEFGDFVAFGDQAVAGYPADEVVHVTTDGTVNIFPDTSLVGKKVIFVEGSTAGTGNVNIFFDATWEDNQDLTVISTGTITYVEPLQYTANSRLSTVSWGDYGEISVFRSEHESVVYSHEDASFVDILDWGQTTGNIITNNNLGLTEVLTYEKFYYSDRAKNGDMPPGFGLLSGSSGTPYVRDWQEP